MADAEGRHADRDHGLTGRGLDHGDQVAFDDGHDEESVEEAEHEPPELLSAREGPPGDGGDGCKDAARHKQGKDEQGRLEERLRIRGREGHSQPPKDADHKIAGKNDDDEGEEDRPSGQRARTYAPEYAKDAEDGDDNQEDVR